MLPAARTRVTLDRIHCVSSLRARHSRIMLSLADQLGHQPSPATTVAVVDATTRTEIVQTWCPNDCTASTSMEDIDLLFESLRTRSWLATLGRAGIPTLEVLVLFISAFFFSCVLTPFSHNRTQSRTILPSSTWTISLLHNHMHDIASDRDIDCRSC